MSSAVQSGFGFWAKSKRPSTRRWEPRKYATANVFMQHPKKARLSWILELELESIMPLPMSIYPKF
jgi:hypothetical protein